MGHAYRTEIREMHLDSDDVKMGLKNVGCEVVDWIQLTQDCVLWRLSASQ